MASKPKKAKTGSNSNSNLPASSPSVLDLTNSSQTSISDIGKAFNQHFPSSSSSSATASISSFRPDNLLNKFESIDRKGKGVKRERSYNNLSEVEILEEIDSSGDEAIKARLVMQVEPSTSDSIINPSLATSNTLVQTQSSSQTSESAQSTVIRPKGALPVCIGGVGASFGLPLPITTPPKKFLEGDDNSTTIKRPAGIPFAHSIDSKPIPPSASTSTSPDNAVLLPSSSALSPGKRTKEEIQARKLLAQEKLKKTQDEKAMHNQLAKALANERFATSQLKAFGISTGGATTYGTGQGGRTKPADGLNLDWKPHESCSEEQVLVLERIRAGDNVFFTGSAGTGKSFLLREVTRLLDHLQRPYQLTATTGIAALQVGGCTLHSFAGLGLGDDSIVDLFDKFTKGKGKWLNWIETKVLIVDEISMLSPVFFTKLSLIAKLLRENTAAFGGMQIILCGDFFQLPPVMNDKKPVNCIRCSGEHFDKIKPENSRLAYEELPKGLAKYEIFRCSDARRGGEIEKGCGLEFRARKFTFETSTWAECHFTVMELTKVFRQSDIGFIKMLEKFRRGTCDDECVQLLKTCGSALKDEIKIKPTNLYPTRAKVAQENNHEYNKLSDQSYSFEALDSHYGPRAKELMVSRLKDVPAAQQLKLKIGAQVMLLTNLDLQSGLVNGSRGVVVSWKSKVDKPGAAASNSNRRSDRFGGEEWRETAANEWSDMQDERVYPEVYFASGVTRVIAPHSWVVQIDRLNSVARSNLPLSLAWALTIHKSQGQTLDAVSVQLDQTFEKGMAYVGLSRARTLSGMVVVGFQAKHIMASPTVKIFYERISESKPFYISPVLPENPLLYIPDHSPLLDRLHRLFGAVPPPLPRGSALPPAPPLPLEAKPLVRLDTPPVYTYESLLQQAAKAYVSGGSQNSATFLEEAKKSIDALIVREAEEIGIEVKAEQVGVKAEDFDAIVGGIASGSGSGSGPVKLEDLMEVDVEEEDVKPFIQSGMVIKDEVVSGPEASSRTTSIESVDVVDDGQDKKKKSRKRGKRVGA